jgi:hypothetical protein
VQTVRALPVQNLLLEQGRWPYVALEPWQQRVRLLPV